MGRFRSQQSLTKGKAPGTLVFVGEKKVENISVDVLSYAENEFNEQQFNSIESLQEIIKNQLPSWINITGIHDVKQMSQLGEMFNLNPLILEDVLNTEQRPKYEEIDDKIFVVLKMLYNNDDLSISNEQISFVLGTNYLITFQEEAGDTFEPVRERLRKATTKIRARGLGYLLYALMDTIVDNYIFLTENLGERVEGLEEKILIETSPSLLNDIKNHKKEIHQIRKAVWPAKECITLLERTEVEYIDKNTKPFVRDLLDHINLANESVDTYREMLTDHVNLYHSGEANKLNEIIRVLTIFSVIFTPLTFLAGIYGMNFKYLPELDYPYAYPIFWGVILTITLGMIIYFQRNGWLKKQDARFRLDYWRKVKLLNKLKSKKRN
jgi:magnesium transporter